MERFSRRDILKLLGATTLYTFVSRRAKISATNVQNVRLPNILIIVLDTLSARNMSIYGYPRWTTPNIERVAAKATVFHRHYAGGNFTTPGAASLLTGSVPFEHRGVSPHGVITDSYVPRSIFAQLTERYNTFAYTHNSLVNSLLYQFREDIDQWVQPYELSLAGHSYAERIFKNDYNAAYDGELIAFRNKEVPNSSLFLSRFERLIRYKSWDRLNKEYADIFPKGVPTYWDQDFPSYISFTLEQANDWVIDQVKTQDAPFLGYIHLFPPHFPYNTRKEFIDIFSGGNWQPATKPEHFFSQNRSQEYLNAMRLLYDEFIAYADAEFGSLYDSLLNSGTLDNTILILTSDHGELFERGIIQHLTPVLYEPLIHIPLLLWTPGQESRQDVHSPTSCVDILPTLFKYISDINLEGYSGLPLQVGKSNRFVPSARSIFAVEAKANPMHKPLTNATLAIVKDRHKLIHYRGYEGMEDRYEFYDLHDDPEELVDLYPGLPRAALEMKEELLETLAKADEPYQREKSRN